MNHEIVVMFLMAQRLRKESGLKRYEREALKRLYLGSDRELRYQISEQVGTLFLEEVFNIELEIRS